MAHKGIGASLPRKEDRRHLHGRSQFVGDLSFPGMLDVAFVRSPAAHARIAGIEIPEGAENRVFTAVDMPEVGPIVAKGTIPGYTATPFPVLARDKVTFVGQLVAICVAASRAEAEDLCEEVFVDLEDLPVLTDPFAAMEAEAPKLHEELERNLYHQADNGADIEELRRSAPVKVSRRYKLARQAMVPLEGKGVVALWDERARQLVVYTSTQSPHLIRTGLAEFLGLEQGRIRVVAPDVGGGFGYKAILHPEELALAWLALHLKRPVRWLEDKREHLTAGANAREHHYKVEAFADAQGRILGIDAELVVDAGAYSIWPHTSAFDALQAAGILPGPYAIPNYRVRTWTVATNKPPLQPYRAVARPGACFAIELTVDAVARAVGREASAVRRDNLVPAAAMPYRSVTGKIYDSGDYPQSLDRALALLDLPALRAEQARRMDEGGPLLGVGFATYTEHTAVSTSTLAPLGIAMVPGHEQAMVRLLPDGGLEVRVGVQSHGQGMETTFAQVASEILGIDPEDIEVVHGDTALTPYSTGTYASRAMVMAGGAVADACERLVGRLRLAAGHLLQCDPAALELWEGSFRGGSGSIAVTELARIWHLSPQELPADADPGGLEVTGGYRPEVDTGAFAYSTHAAVVEIDRDFGTLRLLDYVAVDDCGTRVNPMIVDGQVLGGVVQGIGTGLFEEVPFDDIGQPLTSTLADYLLPGAGDIPAIRLDHMTTPSPHTRFGIKGVGEGGAIAPPAALANAVNDALHALGSRTDGEVADGEVTEVPLAPHRVLKALAAAGEKEKRP